MFWERTLRGGGLNQITEVALRVEVAGLAPGSHGIAITDAASCTRSNSFAPHFDPRGGLHGVLWDVVGHAGDLGNIDVDATGRGLILIQPITAFGLKTIYKKALMVYAAGDDGVTQPDGGAGAVILCGIIHASD